jgi:hypothetical protein
VLLPAFVFLVVIPEGDLLFPAFVFLVVIPEGDLLFPSPVAKNRVIQIGFAQPHQAP